MPGPKCHPILFLVFVLFHTGCDFSTEKTARMSFDVMRGGQGVVFTTATGELMQLDRKSGNVEKLVSAHERFESVTVSPDESRIAVTTVVATREHPEIVVFERNEVGVFAEKTRFPGTLADFGKNEELYFSKGGRYVSAGYGGGFWTDISMWKFSFSDNRDTQLSTTEYFAIDRIDANDTCNEVFYSAQTKDSRNVYRLNDASGEILQITKDSSGTSGSSPSVSMDCKKLTFVSDRNERFNYEIFVEDLASGNVHSLSTVKTFRYVTQPSFCGNRIYFLGASEFFAAGVPQYELWEFEAPDQRHRLLPFETLRGK